MALPDEFDKILSTMRSEISVSIILQNLAQLNAQKFEAAFYANPDLRDVKPPQENLLDIKTLIEQLQKSPELANALAEIIR